MSDFCKEGGPNCKLLSDCETCLSCWAHCFCHDDDTDECKHGTPKVDECDACVSLEPE